ncbi:MAG TPA: DUF3863 domain-containing protein, partial [Puia sp.]|nr:DUF3863 domain-containing protein [Puia sp.]
MQRRSFIKNTALSGAGMLAGTGFLNAMPAGFLSPAPLSLIGGRFITFCIMIRTTPWEVSRDVKLHPREESNWHT